MSHEAVAPSAHSESFPNPWSQWLDSTRSLTSPGWWGNGCLEHLENVHCLSQDLLRVQADYLSTLRKALPNRTPGEQMLQLMLAAAEQSVQLQARLCGAAMETVRRAPAESPAQSQTSVETGAAKAAAAASRPRR